MNGAYRPSTTAREAERSHSPASTLDNYIDATHYGPWINEEIVLAVSEGRERITSLAQVQENDAVIRQSVDTLRAAGAYTDSLFD